MTYGIEEKLRGPGYREIGTGIFVPEEDAYAFAVERTSQNEEEKQEFVDYFFSGGTWVKED